jgi:hypothetical protein
MTNGSIISRGESLQILENDLRRRALEERAAELNNATPEKRAEIMAQIDQAIQQELRRRAERVDLGTLLY